MNALRWIWDKLRRAGIWLYENPVALAAMAGSLVGAYFMWKSRSNKIKSLEDAVQVQAAKRQIAKTEAQAELLEKQSEAKEPEVAELKSQINDSKRRVMEIHEGRPLKEMDDEAVAKLFSDCGF